MPRLVVIIAVLCGCVVHSVLGAEPARRPTSAREAPGNSVLASDLFRSVAVVGSLGVPLWQVATVRGIWYDPGVLAKNRSLIFRVTDINGRRVEKPIGFHRVRPISEQGQTGAKIDGLTWAWMAKRDGNEKPTMSPTANEKWEVVAFETGQIVGFPKEAGEVLPVASRPPGWGVVTELQYLRMRKIK